MAVAPEARYAPPAMPADPPAIEVAQTGAPARRGDGQWDVAFEVRNAGDASVELIERWLPHGQFRAEPAPLTVEAPLPPGGVVRLDVTVEFDEAPGSRVENGFVILRVRWRGEEWRILTRMSVTADSDGAPQASTDLTTAHPVGFSG